MLQQYLQKHADFMKIIHPQPDWKYESFEELVLDCGLEVEAIELPSNIEQGIAKSCYWNCQQIIKKQPDLIYCEGYALINEAPIPLRHAWLLNSERKALDPTWVPPGIKYIGVPFVTEWVESFLENRSHKDNGEHISIFEGNFVEDSSLLKKGLPNGACFK
ncbi:MAG: hypothetical protein QNJ54_06965 [Prochloraceae cyanobacterium]|nr:hypothetical protein [Prochloraceae cyanobacterium]